MSETKLQHVFQIYIRSSLDRVWAGITSAEMTPQYFHNSRVESDWKVGSLVEYFVPTDDGTERVALRGEILEIEPRKRLQHSFEFPRLSDPPSRVTYELKQMGEMIQLVVVHDKFETETETYKSVFKGWSWILSGMKSVLETGQSLPPIQEN